MKPSFSVFLFLRYSAALSQSALPSGQTVTLDEIPYYVPPIAVGTVTGDSPVRNHDFGFSPLTIVNTNATGFDDETLSELKQGLLQKDDVVQPAFLNVISLHCSAFNNSKSPEIINGTTLTWTKSDAHIPTGPYFASSSGKLYRAYRLYADVQGAFSETSIEAADSSHTVLASNIAGQGLAVAVPSRLYYTKTANKPLAGVRLGVKDIFDVKGLKTSNGNRAWYHLYPAANETAVAVQNLVSAGAVIIGKMKTSQFANGETATADWVDIHAPFNPRGDGYNDPSSSSAGPAAGIASYPWLDVALGSDTGGSIRSPSQIQGIYGNRPSHGLVSLDGAMPLSPEFDTAGLMARDPLLWQQASSALYGSNLTISDCYPQSLLTIGFSQNSTSNLDKMLSSFLIKLTNFLSARTVSEFDVTTAWTSSHPTGTPLVDFINSTYEVLSAKQQAKRVRDPFYADYAAAHHGRLPAVNPAPLGRWALGDNSPSTIEEDIANRTRFADWFNTNVLVRDNKTCSDKLLIYVPRVPKPNYRGRYRTGPSLPSAFSKSRFTVMSGAPDIVIPIGEIEYFSEVTNHTEVLPVTVDFMAAKGCDGMLFSLVEGLLASGIISKVKSGRSSVTGDDILF